MGYKRGHVMRSEGVVPMAHVADVERSIRFYEPLGLETVSFVAAYDLDRG
jgi:hypothetical protein